MGAADNLRTEAEAAEELGFSIHKMRKLRAAGEVAFIPGRPVLIMDSDFQLLKRQEAEKAYARWEKRQRKKRGTKPPNPSEDPDASERRRIFFQWLRMRGPSVIPGLAKPTRF